MGANETWNSSVSLEGFTAESRRSLTRLDMSARKSRRIPLNYVPPIDRASQINNETRAARRAASLNRRNITEHIRQSFPDICTENLQAKIFRMFREQSRTNVAGQDKSRRFLFQPFISKTSPNRRYKEWSHTGDYLNGEWSCCLSRESEAGGCTFHMESHEDCCRTVGDVLTHTLVTALEDREAELDAEIQRLENLDEDDLEELRRRRLEEMKENHKRNTELLSIGHGEYTELQHEREFFETVKKSKHVVCHFFRPSTWRCAIVDKHCKSLAEKYIDCRFVCINIEKSPYLAEKLRIVMLPTIMIINKGKTEHSIIGFDEMGGRDDFEVEDLEQVLANWNVIHKK